MQRRLMRTFVKSQMADMLLALSMQHRTYQQQIDTQQQQLGSLQLQVAQLEQLASQLQQQQQHAAPSAFAQSLVAERASPLATSSGGRHRLGRASQASAARQDPAALAAAAQAVLPSLPMPRGRRNTPLQQARAAPQAAVADCLASLQSEWEQEHEATQVQVEDWANELMQERDAIDSCLQEAADLLRQLRAAERSAVLATLAPADVSGRASGEDHTSSVAPPLSASQSRRRRRTQQRVVMAAGASAPPALPVLDPLLLRRSRSGQQLQVNPQPHQPSSADHHLQQQQQQQLQSQPQLQLQRQQQQQECFLQLSQQQ
jgi:PAX-interacting protein 1